jgi:proteasome beta subunit
MELKDLEKLKVLKSGTTTVGIVCRDGVVVGAEKRSTLGYLVASKESEKIHPVTDFILMTTAGIQGDAQALVRYMKAELKLFELQNQRRANVKAAATLLSNILQSGRWSILPWMVQLIVAGFDKKPRIFTLDALGGIEEERYFFSTGSGAPIALGVLEKDYREDMGVEEAEKLVLTSIKSAIERDIASGGKAIDIAVVTKDGIKLSTHKLEKK